MDTFEQRRNERTRDSGAPVSGRDGEIQDFDFAGSKRPADEKSHDSAGYFGDAHIVPCGIPLRRLGARLLEGDDRRKVIGARGADGHSYFLGA